MCVQTVAVAPDFTGHYIGHANSLALYQLCPTDLLGCSRDEIHNAAGVEHDGVRGLDRLCRCDRLVCSLFDYGSSWYSLS